MSNTVTTRITRRLSFVIAGLVFAMVLGGIAIVLIAYFSTGFDLEFFPIYYFFSATIAAGIGLLICARQPTHMVGWLFLITGFFAAIEGSTTTFIALLHLEILEDAYILQGLAAVAGDVSWIPSLMIPLTLILQFFPGGRLPSRRWWPFPVASLLSMIGLATPYIVGPVAPVVLNLAPKAYNPLAISGAGEILNVVNSIAENLIVAGFGGSLLILAVRYRRADRIERTQMKWLFYTAMIGISIMFISAAPVNWPFDIGGIVFISLPTLLAIAIGIAILRYRLFDIDLIIRRTLQYSAVTGILAGVYFGLVVTFQALFTAVGGRQSPIVIVISTLIIAALFGWIRKWVQEIIDRRFFRRRYDAEQALAQFAAAARDEVDLDRLGTALLDVVNETMQPERIQLWLRPVEGQDRHAIGRAWEEDNARI